MKRLLISLLTIAFLIGIGYLYYTNLDKNHFFLNDMYNFPVPKSAELESENEVGKHYIWSKASGDNGIPLSYRLMIKKNGWREIGREGEIVKYTKGKFTIYLHSSTDYIGIMK